MAVQTGSDATSMLALLSPRPSVLDLFLDVLERRVGARTRVGGTAISVPASSSEHEVLFEAIEEVDRAPP
jgi:hypothetical protein